ncbi:hypothetical protein [Vibrio sonorensis]|uniref:hypothetical protein n=1 Tax=Vibrio sonorensis TaxID=1004316 RepID=UPI000A05670B|nr:hypothetical protein [Vibrio sonorensis]
MSNKISINGTTHITSGRSITVSNGKVIIDGKDVTPETKEISILIEGDVESLQADACDVIDVKGNVGKIITQSGDVRCGEVGRSVTTMSGDVFCGGVSGGVTTMSGDISHN